MEQKLTALLQQASGSGAGVPQAQAQVLVAACLRRLVVVRCEGSMQLLAALLALRRGLWPVRTWLGWHGRSGGRGREEEGGGEERIRMLHTMQLQLPAPVYACGACGGGK